MRLDSLMLTYHASTADAARLRRRFMTLSIPVESGPSLRGGVGYVVKAESMGAQGEFFALKRLKVPVGNSDANNPQAAQLEASFRQEYDAHRILSPTGLVPELYGYARIGGEPAILMEWVDGITLRDAAKQLRGADGKVPLEVVADIGLSVLAALRRIEFVDESLVHRDLSPLNIMIRTGKRPLADQVEAGIYDICLIDFGSATMEQEADSSFTMVENFWRGATPSYAPPEMLDRTSDDAAGRRHSHAIDVYALCSVLYELYEGHAPYDTRAQAEHAIYEMKTTEPPRSAETRPGDDGSLRDAILHGLAARQEDRPTVDGLADELQDWEEAHGTSRPWEQTLGELVASDRTAASRTPSSLSPTILEMPSASAAGSVQAPARRQSFRKRHPRVVAALATVAVAVVGVAIAGALTNWFGLGPVQVKDSVNDYSWDELSQISRQISDAEDGKAAERIEGDYHLVNDNGDLDGTQVKDVALSDGTQAQVVITGFRHDERSDGLGVGGIAFSFTEPVGKQAMDTEKRKTRSWDKTSLRTWLAEDFSEQLPSDLSQAIVEVKKNSLVLTPASNGKGKDKVQGVDDDANDLWWTASTESTDDKLWLYSLAEIQGGEKDVAKSVGMSSQEGSALQYELFENQESNASFGHKEASEQSQQASSTGMYSTTSWLRTPEQDNAYGFKTMEKDGSDSEYKGTNPTKLLGVVPGFYV